MSKENGMEIKIVINNKEKKEVHFVHISYQT